MNFVLIGPPGSGKGTQATALCGRFLVPHISTGDLFREHIHTGTPLGLRIRSAIDRGELVPDELVASVVHERINRADALPGFLLDGFPRTTRQAVMLDGMLDELDRSLAGVIWIQLEDEEVVKRLAGRLTCSHCGASFHQQFKPPHVTGYCDLCGASLEVRDDDRPETVRARLASFHARTQPLIEFYEERGLLVPVDGCGTMHEVCRRTLGAVEELVGAATNVK